MNAQGDAHIANAQNQSHCWVNGSLVKTNHIVAPFDFQSFDAHLGPLLEPGAGNRVHWFD